MSSTSSSLHRPWRAAWLPLLAALVLAGCATAPAELPSFDMPAQFREQAGAQPADAPPGHWTRSAPAESQPRGEWWRAFGDPLLDQLVERAVARNTDIEAAAARLSEARALARSTDADRAPQIGLAAGGVRSAGLDRNLSPRPSTLVTAGVDFSYELDLFGKLSRASEAAKLDADSRAGLLQSTRLLVEAETAQTYLALRAVDAERALVRDTVEAYRDTLRLTQSRERAGDVAELDVARVETEVASTESEGLTLDRRRAELEHALAVLVGDLASDFALASGDWGSALPTIPPGVPATVLTRRPDISAAQKSVFAAQARVGVAQAAWFPDIALTGGGGYASADIGDLLKWSARSWGIGALLALPVFDGGRREAGVQGAAARLDGALASYRAQVLVAFREVEDQLSSLRILEQQSGVQGKAVASATRATALSDSRYRNGMVSQLDLLDARRSELHNRRQALQVKSAQYQATVALIRALGGSWDTLPVAAAGAERTPVAKLAAAR
ncbi:efflux transporter outer membrane subunit [Variovorax sp. J22P168]|uniref:efflux transporter outer membrane subunit n=1 Tax=Variovorax jilinensis TaxID=3053513 RepID=UPI00257662FE|nr:efflux transporter outer membrane subunit [Variovorax sp. J22P168]MDM0013103.1 efflux transporter outer membrane subunit [Variovorax sp. J22P168]